MFSVVIEKIAGVIFIVSAVLKALDMRMFELQILGYGILEDPQAVTAAAFGTVGVETLLGMVLLAGMRFKGAVWLFTLALLAGFTALVGYGWLFQDLDECGCFGAYVEMTPAATITKNLIMIGFIGAAWFRRRSLAGDKPPGEWLALRVAAAVLGALAVTGAGVYGVYGAGPAEADRPFAEMTYQDGAVTVELGEGEHLIAMYGANCEHCMGTVPDLHGLMFAEGVPPVAAFLSGEPDEIEQFRAITQPLFPLEPIELVEFVRHIGSAPPRFILVRDGAIVAYWDDEAPEAEAVRAALTQE